MTSLAVTLAAAAQCVQGILTGQSLSDCLASVPTAQRPAVQALSFHATRHLGYTRAVRRLLVARTPKDPFIEGLLLVALSLLETALLLKEESRDDISDTWPVYQAHTIVNETVNALRGPVKGYRSLVNATLRNYGRQRTQIRVALADDLVAVWNYPQWWIDRLAVAYPDCWEELLNAGNQAAPLILRVNRRRTSAEHVLAEFAKAQVAAKKLDETAIWLPKPLAVSALPGFREGWWSVQDLSAQRAAPLLPVSPGMRVLDACAAPGGKTAHLLELVDVSLLALDADARRLQRVQENLDRLGLNSPNVRLRCADARDVSSWWDAQPFEAILADAPCTGSGVVRRHPDIRWLRRPSDIEQTVSLQQEILDALWQVLQHEGHLLFVTCSIFPEEGEQQAQAFSQRHRDAQRLPAPGQVLPLRHTDHTPSGDGFFYALFRKTSLENHSRQRLVE